MEDERLNLPSASSIERVVNCPGSGALIASLPPRIEKQTEVASFGDDVHKALEDGVEFAEGDTRETVRRALSFMADNALNEWVSGEDIEVVTVREQRMFIRDRRTLQPIASAKLDVAHIQGTRAYCCDYKTGFLPVTPSDKNWQMRTQAVCLWHEYPQVTSVRVAVAAYRLKSVFDVTEYDLDALRRAEFQLQVAFERAKEQDAPRFPGTWCRYCPAKVACREGISWATLEVSGVDVTASQLSIINHVRSLSPETLAKVYRKKGVMDTFLDAVSQRLKHMTDAELAAIGLKKKPGSNRRKIVNPTNVAVTLTSGDEPLIKMSALSSLMKFELSAIDNLVATKFGLKDKDVKAKVAELFGTAIEEKRDADKLEEL